MNSPTDRASPTLSESSSDTPDQELEELSRGGMDDNSPFTQIHGSGSSSGVLSSASMAPKRRLPGGLVIGSAGGARDPKSRRKEVRGGGGMWDGGMGMGMGGGRGRGDELVDSALVDQLRAQFGDPFDETSLKKKANGGN